VKRSKRSESELERWGIDVQHLANRRRELRLTQQDLAVRVGTSVGNISKMERGAKGCHLVLARKIALVLACSIDYLAGLSDAP
jgi:DNA-binding XRE family transcriptional regulator